MGGSVGGAGAGAGVGEVQIGCSHGKHGRRGDGGAGCKGESEGRGSWSRGGDGYRAQVRRGSANEKGCVLCSGGEGTARRLRCQQHDSTDAGEGDSRS